MQQHCHFWEHAHTQHFLKLNFFPFKNVHLFSGILWICYILLNKSSVNITCFMFKFKNRIEIKGKKRKSFEVNESDSEHFLCACF